MDLRVSAKVPEVTKGLVTDGRATDGTGRRSTLWNRVPDRTLEKSLAAFVSVEGFRCPSGTRSRLTYASPALKRRAIITSPCGTELRRVPA